MKSLTFRNLFLVLVLTLAVAGIAWAGQTAPTPEVAPEAPAVEAELDELFLDPAEAGACCMANCFEQRSICWESCPPQGDPNRQACMNNCSSEFESCKSQC